MKLYQHQLDILKEDPLKTGLFLGTGSGKTSTALALAKGHALVICPKTQKQDDNWGKEFTRMINHNIPTCRAVTTISKEEFRRDWERLPHYDTVIVDEAHTCLGVTPDVRYKNKQPIPKTSQLFEALQQYLERTKPERLYLCTATIGKSPMTIWAAAVLLGKKWDFFKFRQTFYFQLNRPGRPIWVIRTDAETKERLALNVRKIGYVGQLSNYFDVPDQTYTTRYVEKTKEQEEAIEEAKIDYPDPLVFVGKCHQIENGLLTGDEFNDEKRFKNAKLEAIADLAYQFPQMIIFARYTGQIKMINQMLQKEGYYVQTLDGKTKDKGEVLENLKQRDRYILIAQSQISAGWELPDCPVMVFASMTNSFVDRVQGEGRILRANRLKKNLYIDLVVRGGIDQAVYNSIKNKKDFNERIYVETL